MLWFAALQNQSPMKIPTSLFKQPKPHTTFQHQINPNTAKNVALRQPPVKPKLTKSSKPRSKAIECPDCALSARNLSPARPQRDKVPRAHSAWRAAAICDSVVWNRPVSPAAKQMQPKVSDPFVDLTLNHLTKKAPSSKTPPPHSIQLAFKQRSQKRVLIYGKYP